MLAGFPQLGLARPHIMHSDKLECAYLDNCVNNKMLERDWLFTALIYALIGCFRSELSDYKHL